METPKTTPWRFHHWHSHPRPTCEHLHPLHFDPLRDALQVHPVPRHFSVTHACDAQPLSQLLALSQSGFTAKGAAAFNSLQGTKRMAIARATIPMLPNKFAIFVLQISCMSRSSVLAASLDSTHLTDSSVQGAFSFPLSTVSTIRPSKRAKTRLCLSSSSV